MVFQDGVTRNVQHVTVLVVLKTLGTQCYTLIQRDMIADDSRFADNHTRTVVDGKILANLRTWVDVDTRFAVCLLGDDTWNDRHLQLVQLVGDAVVRHRVHRGVAEYHLTKVRCSRVVIKHRLYVGIKQSLHLGQLINKCQRFLFGYGIYLGLGTVGLAVLAELQSVCYLLGEQRGQFLHPHTDMIGTYSLIWLSLFKIIRKNDTLNQRYNTLYALYRREWCNGGRHHTQFAF